MRWTRKDSEVGEVDKGTYWISIGDLITGLLIIFILTLSYYMLKFSHVTAELTENRIKRAKILQQIKKDIETQGIKVKVDLEHGILRLPEGILFDIGRAEIREDGRELIQKLGPILYGVLTRPKFKGDVETIFIEGHTDNVPIHTAQFASNWELSTQRAINTWRLFIEITPQLAELKNNKGEPLFSCSGYADTRPVRSNETVEGRRENRRIDLRFSMTPPQGEEENTVIKEIEEDLKN